MKNKKTILYFVLIALDVIITVFLLVISIIMLVKTMSMTTAEILSESNQATFIGYLQNHTTFYFCLFVLPLFLILAANIIGLVIYVRKSTKSEPVKINDLSEAQKEELRKQILADLQKQQQTTIAQESNETNKE